MAGKASRPSFFRSPLDYNACLRNSLGGNDSPQPGLTTHSVKLTKLTSRPEINRSISEAATFTFGRSATNFRTLSSSDHFKAHDCSESSRGDHAPPENTDRQSQMKGSARNDAGH